MACEHTRYAEYVQCSKCVVDLDKWDHARGCMKPTASGVATHATRDIQPSPVVATAAPDLLAAVREYATWYRGENGAMITEALKGNLGKPGMNRWALEFTRLERAVAAAEAAHAIRERDRKSVV